MRFETLNDFNILIRRLNGVPLQMQQCIDSMREGMSRGIVASKAQLTGVEDVVQKFIDSESFDELNYPLEQLKANVSLSPEEIDRLKSEILTASLQLKEAFKTLLNFLKNEYSNVLRDIPGCVSLPNGNVIYETCLKYHTTTNLTAEEIHEIGLQQVAIIENRYYTEILPKLGYAPNEFELFINNVSGTSFILSVSLMNLHLL
jgi:uncharacterized protein (DUF885 family)